MHPQCIILRKIRGCQLLQKDHTQVIIWKRKNIVPQYLAFLMLKDARIFSNENTLFYPRATYIFKNVDYIDILGSVSVIICPSQTTTYTVSGTMEFQHYKTKSFSVSIWQSEENLEAKIFLNCLNVQRSKHSFILMRIKYSNPLGGFGNCSFSA